MVDNATPIGGPNGTSLSSDHTLANGGHVESVEWLKALYKLREANTTNELRAQSQRDLYSAYLKHKLKAISDPQGSGGVSAPSSLASLHERNTLLLEDALKVLPAGQTRPEAELPLPAMIKRKNKWLLEDLKPSAKAGVRTGRRLGPGIGATQHAGKLYAKARASLNAQLAKVLLRVRVGKGDNSDPDDSDPEDTREREREKDCADVDLAPYWKVQYLQDIAHISQQSALLDRMQADPENFQRVFSPAQLDRSLAHVRVHTNGLKSEQYYDAQLAFLRAPEKPSAGKDLAGLFERLDEEPSTANTTLLEEILASSAGLRDTGGKGRKRKGRLETPTVVEEGAEVSPQTVRRVVGILPVDIERIRKYQVRPWKLPKFSDKFDKADTVSALFGTGAIERLSSSANYLSEHNLVLLDRAARGSKKPAGPLNPEEREAAMKEREEKRARYRQMSPAQRETAEKAMVSKQWLWIARKEVPKMHKIYTKYHADAETNAKRVAVQCMKEVRKKAIKCHKLEKEAPLRAKRVHRDVLIYWRKKEKEIVEMKRKRDKIEKEIKKKEEEQREALLMRKRLEFLIRQSGIYANFMARKLGTVEEEKKPAEPIADPEVEIDEALAKKKVQDMINSHLEDLRALDQETQALRVEHGGPAGVAADTKEVQEEELDYTQKNQFDAAESTMSRIVAPPKMFLGGLKEYQLKGLRWLDNLHEQAINGILADEMGLGKTIQAIAFLAHLAENKGNWGPFLIVSPSSTLYNWQQEFQRFCPGLRVLPYWGSLAERRTLRKFFNAKQLYTPSSPFHVLVTSYPLIVADEKSFHRIIWQHMILDEAQAIKNINSQRWRTLLSFNCRNRLLMTGTPIQNSMAELWALLHFIMPKLFDNHEQFQEWFSKDIEANSQNEKELNSRQLSRLHAVLKPFMLRRVKKDVEHEIGPKEEVELTCEMTSRQKLLYQGIKDHLSNIGDLFSLVDSRQKMENLMNIVMQLRKVCNHPELFERRMGKTPALFVELAPPKPLYSGFNEVPSLTYTAANPISYQIPRMIFDELFGVADCFPGLNNPADVPGSKDLLEAFSPARLYEGVFSRHSTLSVLRFLGMSFSELGLVLRANELLAYVCLMHYQERMNGLLEYREKSRLLSDVSDPTTVSTRSPIILLVRKTLPAIVYQSTEFSSRPLVFDTPLSLKQAVRHYTSKVKFFVPAATTVPFGLTCSSQRFCTYMANTFSSDTIRCVLLGNAVRPPHNPFKGKAAFVSTSLLPNYCQNGTYERRMCGYELFEQGLLPDLFYNMEGAADVEVPKFNKLVSDCAKLRILDDLLKKLKEEGHRCLIFCQMTKMLDILEDHLSWRKYTYFRMDGSSSIADRRDMVHEYQTSPNIFCFLLSTRAGGLGVTLTAADTVIFYDNDWNPTMDAQATDRAHRIGQTKKVTIYRLITKGTVEERIVKRARQKQSVQATVYSGGAFKGDVFKPKEVIELLYDEDERKRHQPKVKPEKKKKETEEEESEKAASEGEKSEEKKKEAATKEKEKAREKEKEKAKEKEKKTQEPKQLFAVKKSAQNGHKPAGEEKMSDSGDDSDLKFEVNAEMYDT